MYHSLTCIGKKRVCVIYEEDWSESLRRILEVRGIEVMKLEKRVPHSPITGTIVSRRCNIRWVQSDGSSANHLPSDQRHFHEPNIVVARTK